MMLTAYFRRIRSSSDVTKRRWIGIVGGTLGVVIVATWVVYITATLPNVAVSETARSDSSAESGSGDILTGGVRRLRDMFGERWRAASDRIGESWKSLGTLMTDGNEFSITDTSTQPQTQPQTTP